MAIALVTSGSIAGSASGGTSAPLNTTGATLLVIVDACQNGTTPSDSKGNTWTLAILVSPTGEFSSTDTYYAANPIVGTGHTFTNTPNFSESQILAFSGVVTTSPLDTPTSASMTSGTPGSVTPTNNGSLIITGVKSDNPGDTYTIGSGYTIAGQIPFSAGVNFGGAAAYLIQTTAAAANPTWNVTPSGAFDQVASTQCVFIAAAGGAAAQNPYVEPPFLSAWQQSSPLPTLPTHRPQGAGPTTNSPYAPEWLPTVLRAWQPPDPLPTLGVKTPQGTGPTKTTPFSRAWLPQVISSWVPADPLPTLRSKVPHDAVTPFNPRGPILYSAAWQIPDPLPTLAAKLPQDAGPTKTTPFSRAWLPAVLQAWQPPDPLPTLTAKLVSQTVNRAYAQPAGIYAYVQTYLDLPILNAKLPQGAGPTTNGAYTRPWVTPILQAWQPPDPLPTLPVHLPQGFVPNPVGYTRPWVAPILQTWQPPDPLPILNAKLPQGAGPTTNSPYVSQQLAALQAWQVTGPLPTLSRYVPQTQPLAFVPGTKLYVPPTVADTPLPTLGAKLPQGAGPAANTYQPRPWQQVVLTSWVPPEPLPTLTAKLPQAFIPPIVSPYTPNSRMWQDLIVRAWQTHDALPYTLIPFSPGTPVRVPSIIWSPYVEPPMFRNQPDEWWPQLVPQDEYADFSYDATDDLAPGDAIVGLSVRVAPSGPGEVVMSRLGLGAPALITVWLTGGVAGRVYFYEITITTAELRTIPILIGQRCTPVLAYVPIPPPPKPGFGSPVTWP